uniref:2'-5' RNA ligase family protein n=1 Tax=Streptomyces sp. NBC_00003 TaxID=2903608 RepID=A0AAU2V7R3_9ACTN
MYAVPDLKVDPALGVLVEASQSALKPYPVLPLPNEMLHVTLEMVSGVPSDQITLAERAELVTSLETHLAEVPAFQFLAGSPVANRAGVYLDCWPDIELNALHQKARSAIQAVRGPDAVRYRGGRPHCSLGYSYANGDSDQLQSALRAISPSHAHFTVNSVALVDVTFTLIKTPSPTESEESAWDFTFTPLHTIALAAPGNYAPVS